MFPDGDMSEIPTIKPLRKGELSFSALEKGEPVSTVSPYWRMVDPANLLAKRLAGGPTFIRERPAAEGWGGGGIVTA
ncbi:hypothetical protein M2308_002620 [Rhizobium leguminosarum]|nr:hypothetical protein [Rhizobium leguminosarum]